MPAEESFLILGGAGMVGAQVVRQVARKLRPRRIVVAALYQQEVREALREFQREFPLVHFAGFWGDVFVRAEFNSRDRRRQWSRARLLASDERRRDLYQDLFGDVEDAYRGSQLVGLILEHRPDVIVDSINTATAISYQDAHAASAISADQLNALVKGIEAGDDAATRRLAAPAQRALETLILSQSVPQLVRHVVLLHRAMCEAGTRLYLKIGTTGTGGMGLNIPYTHSEDRPSAKLMTKTAIAFAHTGLMFLMARTPGPIVKEIKPGALIGYADITCRTVHERGQPLRRFSSRAEPLGESLVLRQPEADYEQRGKLEMVVVDTGENGLFTKGEFETITHLRQMEFITPEEIAREVVLEIQGANTGRDVIAAIDGAVMNPTYRSGYLREAALTEIARLERETGTPSVALGQLGPPELGKLLWEAHLLKLQYGTLTAVLGETSCAIADALHHLVESDETLRTTIVSVGLPILTPDGRTLLRGPFLRIPEQAGVNRVPLTSENVESWAAKGWVDLRAQNFEKWRARFERMRRAAHRLRGRGSAAITRDAYLSDEISIGAVVGWIFNNDEGREAFRIK